MVSLALFLCTYVMIIIVAANYSLLFALVLTKLQNNRCHNIEDFITDVEAVLLWCWMLQGSCIKNRVKQWPAVCC